jgi:protein phosphatase methylesterase 1
MIYTSDNFETGVVVDYITGTHNFHPVVNNASDPRFLTWWRSRNFTQSYFDSRGLLEDQVIISKTYPTNSGSMPSGAEALLREVLGQNQMKPKCAASLMAELSSGIIHPDAKDYMLGMLQHARYSYSSIGMGTPPGTVLHNKIGNAYDTLEEIAYIMLPNGRNFVLAIYTNGYEPTEPNIDNLSYLAELIIDGLGLDVDSSSRKHILSSSKAQTHGKGWTSHSSLPDKYGSHFLQNEGHDPNANATWTFQPDQDGIFEFSVWNPEHTSFGSVTYTLTHAYGIDSFNVRETVNGGRWIKMGDFNLLQGQKAVVSVKPSSSQKPFVVDSIKFAQWPSCGSIPGTSCFV